MEKKKDSVCVRVFMGVRSKGKYKMETIYELGVCTGQL